MTEDQFPTINDAIQVLERLRDDGYGELPVQLLVVPDSTIQAIARAAGQTDDSKPAIMLGFCSERGREFDLISPERMALAGVRVPVQ